MFKTFVNSAFAILYAEETHTLEDIVELQKNHIITMKYMVGVDDKIDSTTKTFLKWFRVTEAPETGAVFEEIFISVEQLISGEVEILQGISRIPQELKKDESQKDYDPYAQTWHNVYQTYE